MKTTNFKIFVGILLLMVFNSAVAQELSFKITEQYLNIPIERDAPARLIKLYANGRVQREFPVQIAESKVDYWIFIDVSQFAKQKITLTSNSSQKALNQIYQSDIIADDANLYNEALRPQHHFTAKRGWTNDVNGLIYYNNTYHLFWQAFPFGVHWNTGFMYWGHAVSDDMIHWTELPPALMPDKLGSPWSGTALIDHNNAGGWGKDAMVLYYTAFDQLSGKQVQCIAYSTDKGKTFKRHDGNPVLDSNKEARSNDTRDPKVFWYTPTNHWVMALFERNGTAFYSSVDMKNWKKESFFEGLHECPDFFEIAVDGDLTNTKWVLHGASSDYFVGDFDGKKFTPTSPKQRYADGLNRDNNAADILYAGITFENMPNKRRVQMAWGRGIEGEGMPFTQVMLFPVEFALKSTPNGLRLRATPIEEIATLHGQHFSWQLLTAREANDKLESVPRAELHIKMKIKVEKGTFLRLRYQGNEFVNIGSDQLLQGENEVEILIDRLVAEIFINNGERYIVKELARPANNDGLVFDSEKYGPQVSSLDVWEMKSMWAQQKLRKE